MHLDLTRRWLYPQTDTRLRKGEKARRSSPEVSLRLPRMDPSHVVFHLRPTFLPLYNVAFHFIKAGDSVHTQICTVCMRIARATSSLGFLLGPRQSSTNLSRAPSTCLSHQTRPRTWKFALARLIVTLCRSGRFDEPFTCSQQNFTLTRGPASRGMTKCKLANLTQHGRYLYPMRAD